MDPMKAQQLAAELEVEMMADMYNRYDQATISFNHFNMTSVSDLGLRSSFIHKVKRRKGFCCNSGRLICYSNSFTSGSNLSTYSEWPVSAEQKIIKVLNLFVPLFSGECICFIFHPF